MTWQVAQLRLPPQSAAMPSTPAATAACIRLWPVRAGTRSAAPWGVCKVTWTRGMGVLSIG